MTGQWSSDIIDTVRSRVDIVRLIGEYIPLRKTGRMFKGICPFHKEKTPSFMVNSERQIFKCFGCGEGGNVFTFLMKFENLTFPQALERLAAQVNVNLPQFEPESDGKKTKKEILFKIMSSAQQLFEEALRDDLLGAQAREYLAKRGFQKNQFLTYGFGYAPDAWDYLTHALPSRQFSLMDLEDAGLVIANEARASFYDRFRNRIIFPIREHREGKIVAFGGRTLGNDPAKYLNTPETPIYHKGKILYGLRESMGDIRATRKAIIVEGYFDRLSLYQAGVRNVVAPCGTSLTIDQVRLLKQFADRFVILFDSDQAGIAASRRALELCLIAGVETRVVCLPSGKDPDDFIRSHGKEEFDRLETNSLHAIDFLIDSSRKRHDMTTSAGRRSAVEEMVPFLGEIENPIDRGSAISRISDLISVPENSVWELTKFQTRRKSYPADLRRESVPASSQDSGIANINTLEKDLFTFILSRPKRMQLAMAKVLPDLLISSDGKALYQIIAEEFGARANIDVACILTRIERPALANWLTDLAMACNADDLLVNEEDDRILGFLYNDLRRTGLRMQMEAIRLKLKESSGSGDESAALLKKQMELAREIQSIQ